jgi:hypothetical protein
MAVTRTDRNQVFRDGQLVSEQVVQVDVTVEVNDQTLRDRAQTALANNQAFLALATPTTAQAITQVKALTRQTNALIRLMLRALDNIDDA